MTQIPVAGLHAELALGTAKLQSGVSDADRLLNRLQDKMTGTGRKAKKTGDEIDTGIGRGLKGAAASASAFDRRMDFLQKRFDPLYAASKRYEGELRLLDEAQKRGAISSATYTRNLDRLNAELAGVDTGVAGATAQMGRFNGVASGMSAQTGNIAAQFQDIGVQLAGGQSPFLIALQQGTQLTGVFNQMGGGIRQVGPALMAAFSSLLSPLSLATIGVIAFGGAIFQWFTGSQEKAKSLEEAIGDVSSAVGDLQRITDLLDGTDLTGIREQFGGLTADVVELLSLQRELAVMDAMRGISDAISAARESMDGWITSGLDGIRAAFDTTYDRARQIQMLMDEVAAATTPQEALDRTIALRKAVEEVAGPLNNLSDSAFDMLKALAEGESALRQVVVEAERSETALYSARVEAERLAATAPGAGWMGTAIKETNLLIGRLIEARQQQGALAAAAASLAYDRELARTGQSSGPDSVRSRVQFGGGAFAPPVRGAGLRFSGVVGSSGSGSIGRSSSGRAGGSEAAGLSDIAREVERLNKAVEDGTTPLEKYGAGLAKLGDLKKNGLTDVAYSKEAARLNEELTGSLPLVGDVADAFGAFVSRGFSDFKSFTNSIMGSFKKMLAEMIATAAKNQILIAIGAKEAGGGGLLGGLLGGGGGGGGLLGGLGKLLGIGGGAAGGGLLGGLGGAAVLGPIGAGVALLGGLFGRRRAKKRAEQERRAAEEAQRAAAAEAEKQQRTGLENQIFSLQGNTAELRRRELEALAPANRALQERIWQLEDEQRVSEERKGLEGALLTIEGNTAELRRRELDSLTPANRELQERIWKLEDEQRASEELKGLEGELLVLQGNTAELRRRELETLIPANREMQERIWQLEDEQRVAQERKGLEEELLSIEGNTAELRRRELDALIPANQELQKRIWQLQDEQRVAQELKSLEEELLRLQGNTAELRRRELAALAPANQEMQNRIWKLQEEQRIAEERKGLEEQLLRLQGNTAELRRRELEALDPSNRALQKHIWSLEDAAEIAEKLSEAMNRLNEEDFATLLDFNRARAALAYGNAAPSVVTIDPKVNPRNRDDRHERLFTSMNNRLAQVEKYFTRWDIDGMPAERAA